MEELDLFLNNKLKEKVNQVVKLEEQLKALRI